MPNPSPMKTLRNTEFFVDVSSPSPVRAIQDGKYVPYSEIPENLINILYARFLDYPDIMRCCISENDTKRDTVEKMLIKAFGKLDGEMDIDENDVFHFDPADLEEMRRECSLNMQIHLADKTHEAQVLAKSISSIESSIHNLKTIR